MDKIPEQTSFNGIKVVLFGPESSGKTTLAKSLALALDGVQVDEFARDYLQDKWDKEQMICSYEDLMPIIKGQIELENKAVQKNTNLIICDTNPLQYQVYCRYYFNKDLPEPAFTRLDQHHYDLYLLTGIDVPWEKDDLRDRPNPADRLALYQKFESELIARKLSFIPLHGDQSTRLRQAKQAIKSLEKIVS